MNRMHTNAEIVRYGARIINQTVEQLVYASIEGANMTRPFSIVLSTQILATTLYSGTYINEADVLELSWRGSF
jgi:hypothetical protein